MSDAPDSRQLGAEDDARAQWYALISRLFHSPPDAALLHGLAAAPDGADEGGDGPFLDAWRGLRSACADAQADAVRSEFDDLFVGVGKAAVTPYTSAYAVPQGSDRHLLALRGRLREWGLGRRESVFETEDHVCAVCDTMRWLIEQGRPLEEQREFFMTYLDPALPALCDALRTNAAADFYRSVGALARAFQLVEREAFELHAAE